MTSPDEPTPDDPTDPVEPAVDAPPPAAPLGEVERVPLKVVPIYVQPLEDEPLEDEPLLDEPLVEEETAKKRRTPAFALATALLTAGTVAVHVAAIVVASGGDYPDGTLLAYVAVGLSVLAVITGVVAGIRGPARGWVIAAVVLAVLANPVVLLSVLRFLSGLQTT
ncbi:hypothetical protein BH09ACT5_BH09ACT5_10610 [soil metagenome]